MHGEAVAIGMIHASRLAERLGRIDASVTDGRSKLLWRLCICPTTLPAKAAWLPVDEVLDRMRLDKKTLGGTIRFVLPSRMGQVELVDKVPVEKVRGVLDDVL